MVHSKYYKLGIHRISQERRPYCLQALFRIAHMHTHHHDIDTPGLTPEHTSCNMDIRERVTQCTAHQNMRQEKIQYYIQYMVPASSWQLIRQGSKAGLTLRSRRWKSCNGNSYIIKTFNSPSLSWQIWGILQMSAAVVSMSRHQRPPSFLNPP